MKSQTIFNWITSVSLLGVISSNAIAHQSYHSHDYYLSSQEHRNEDRERVSAQIREDKKVGVFVGSGSRSLGDRGSLSLGFFVDPDFVVEVGGASSQYTNLSDYQVNTTEAFIDAKQFVGNSFYVSTGLSFEKLSYEKELVYGGASFKDVFDFDRSTINFGLGNRWQFDHLTIGCDWVSLGWVLATGNETVRLVDVSDSRVLKNERLEDFRKAQADGTLSFLNFHIGYTF